MQYNFYSFAKLYISWKIFYKIILTSFCTCVYKNGKILIDVILFILYVLCNLFTNVYQEVISSSVS